MTLPRSFFIGCTLAALLGGCASSEDKATETMNASLDGQFTNYDDLQSYPGGVTCGKYLVMDVQGDVEYKDFIVIETEAINLPTKLDLTIFCSNDPKASLNEALDIDYDAQKATIDTIVDDFTRLADPLLAYERDNGHFPWTDQTLEALVTPKTAGNFIRNFPEGGYIDSIPVDPWGNAYDYVCEPFAGVRILYKLKSLGADGEEGGTGINADIKSTYLKYFAHIEKVG